MSKKQGLTFFFVPVGGIVVELSSLNSEIVTSNLCLKKKPKDIGFPAPHGIFIRLKLYDNFKALFNTTNTTRVQTLCKVHQMSLYRRTMILYQQIDCIGWSSSGLEEKGEFYTLTTMLYLKAHIEGIKRSKIINKWSNRINVL